MKLPSNAGRNICGGQAPVRRQSRTLHPVGVAGMGLWHRLPAFFGAHRHAQSLDSPLQRRFMLPHLAICLRIRVLLAGLEVLRACARRRLPALPVQLQLGIAIRYG